MYLKRVVETRILYLSTIYPVVMVCGSRQVGKSTVINKIKEPNRTYISLDDLNIRKLAIEDPSLFIQTFNPPLIIDEFQYAPELLSLIKLEVDRRLLREEDAAGLYWLTGSQQFKMMKFASESLAGRVGIVDLSSLSNEEINEVDKGFFTPQLDALKNRFSQSKNKTIHQLYESIFNGGMPKLITSKIDREDYYSNYVRTYLERDIHDLAQVGNTTTFYNYLLYLSARIAQELNYADASKIIGVSAPTIKNWTSILVSSGIIFLLYPYGSSITKRLVKTPKLYFMDSGLCAYLARWPNAITLENGAMDGAYLENYAISEIVKSYYNHGKKLNIFYYRDFDQKEIDLLFVDAEKIIPLEIKKNVYPSNLNKNLSFLGKFNLAIEPEIVLCMTQQIMPLHTSSFLVPISIL